MKCVILENLYTTLDMESIPFINLGKSRIKSIRISTKSSLGTGKGVYNTWGITLDLTCLYVMHLS